MTRPCLDITLEGKESFVDRSTFSMTAAGSARLRPMLAAAEVRE
jgi:hypothetical protein